jgi:hypothetical protein
MTGCGRLALNNRGLVPALGATGRSRADFGGRAPVLGHGTELAAVYTVANRTLVAVASGDLPPLACSTR